MCDMTRPYMWDVNGSCHTYEWVMSHIWIRHVTPKDEVCHTYEWVMSHIRMSHVTHMNESCHTCEWVMSHIWTSHVTHTKDAYLACLKCIVTKYLYVFYSLSQNICTCGTTHAYVSHESFVSVSWPIIQRTQVHPHILLTFATHYCNTLLTFVRVARFMRMCHMIHSCLCHENSARKASWNEAGVEPVHWRPADSNPNSLMWMNIRKQFSLELFVRLHLNSVLR